MLNSECEAANWGDIQMTTHHRSPPLQLTLPLFHFSAKVNKILHFPGLVLNEAERNSETLSLYVTP